jgi:hypothetical protein
LERSTLCKDAKQKYQQKWSNPSEDVVVFGRCIGFLNLFSVIYIPSFCKFVAV